jgi:hypothetical protein
MLARPQDIGKWFGDVALLIDRYHRENEALRLMLLEKGLTRAQIHQGVKRRLDFSLNLTRKPLCCFVECAKKF